MQLLRLPESCALLLLACLALEGAPVMASSPPTAHRVLRAATKRSTLFTRSMRISPKFDAELAYTEEDNGWSGKTTFASQVKVSSSVPVLNLEDVEHHLRDVHCSGSLVKLKFVDTSSARDAMYAARSGAGGRIITSHESCNEESERAVYEVHDVLFADNGEALELAVTRSSWQDAFDSIDMSFGHTAEDHIFRRHVDFAKLHHRRQDQRVEIPSNITEDVNTAVFDLTSELRDTTFAAESFLAGLQELLPIPELPIELGCKLCSTRGQLSISQGAIKIDLSQIDLIPDIFQGGDDGKDLKNVITGGFMELVATGVGARLEMFARPKASGSFEVTLASLPVLGFIIPGIGRAGAVFEPRIATDFDISGGFDLTYGIDVSIPDGSRIRTELTNLANSEASGFPGSSITPLPIVANIKDVEVLLGLAFKPTIPIGFEFTDKLRADATISMILPRLSAKLSTSNEQNCGNSSNATLPNAPWTNNTQISVGNQLDLGLISIVEANVSLSLDVGLDIKFPFLPPPFQDIGAAANLFSTNLPIITSCAAPERAFMTLTNIVAAPTSANYTASATTSLVTLPTPYNMTPPGYVDITTHNTATKARTEYATWSYVNATSRLSSLAYQTGVLPSSTPCASQTQELPTLAPSSGISVPISTLLSRNSSSSSESLMYPLSSSSALSSASALVSESRLATTSALVPQSTLSMTSSLASPSAVPDTTNLSNAATTSLIIDLVPQSPSAPPPAPIVTMPTGFLATGNIGPVPAQQTEIAIEFTGAAAFSTHGRHAGSWHVSLLALSAISGAAMLLL